MTVRQLTRRALLGRAIAGSGSAFALLSVGPGVAAADWQDDPSKIANHNCPIREAYTNNGPNCNVKWGGENCILTHAYVESPNHDYFMDCWKICDNGCNCSPRYVQARAAACNSGRCSCTKQDL